MTSLRQTRRMSLSTTLPSPQRRDTEPLPHTTPVPELILPLHPGMAGTRQTSKPGSRARSVRKVKSNLAVRSQRFDEYEHGDYRESLSRHSGREGVMINKVSNVESREWKKGQRRSQSAHPRNPNDWGEDHAHQSLSTDRYSGSGSGHHSTHPPYPQHANFLVPKSRDRSRSHSPSSLPSSPIISLSRLEHCCLSDDAEDESPEVKPRLKTRKARVPPPTSRASMEDVPTQRQHRPSKLITPMSRAVSPLPLPQHTLKVPDDDDRSLPSVDNHVRSPSPAIPRPYTPSSTSNSSIMTAKTHTVSRLPSRAAPQSWTPHPSPHLAPSSQPEVPHTLRDVTRRLEQDRGRLRGQRSTHSEIDGRRNEHTSTPEHFSESASATPIPSRSKQSYAQPDSAEFIAQERHPHPHLKLNSGYGLALMNESGNALGVKESMLPLPLSRSAMAPDVSAQVAVPETVRVDPEFSERINLRSSTTKIASDTISKLSIQHGDRNPVQVFFPTTTELGTVEKITTTLRDHSRSGSSIMSLAPERQAFCRRNGHNDEQPVVARRQVTAPSSIRTSSPPSSLPRMISGNPGTTRPAGNRYPLDPARSAIPNLPSSRPSRNVSQAPPPFSQKPSGSDASADSIPRLRKLVIRNPDSDRSWSSSSSSSWRHADRPSSSSSSNPETPGRTPAAAISQDFTICAASASQTSVGDYIVPDDVAARVTNEEERRRKALAGIVHGLRLEADSDASNRSPRSQGTTIKHYSQGDDDEDDEAFFSRISIPDDEDSLLEEPEPEEVGFRHDKDDSELSSDEDISVEEIEDGIQVVEKYEDNAPALPPTPKFVHPIGHGDDLESRITRVASLHRISTSVASYPHCGTSALLDRGPRVRPQLDAEEGKEIFTHPTCVRTTDDVPDGDRSRSPSHSKRNAIERLQAGELAPKEQRLSKGVQSHNVSPAQTAPVITPSEREVVPASLDSQGSNLVTDDELSSVGGGRLSAGSGTESSALSSGAEALFRQLQVEADAQEKGNTITRTAPSRETCSSSRAGDHNKGPSLKHSGVSSLRTWRSTLPFGAYDSLAERHGPAEMRRQEIIWELCETEQAFVKSLRLILRLFVQPLRHEDKTWIPGVPRDVTRLFDWFDDIMHLHSQVSSALHAARSAQYPVVIRIAETLRPFVPRLELHQPYLVRLESVSAAVEIMSKDVHSDFGEFVRIQTASSECESMNLPSFLLKPVQRLMKYPLFFKQLWELTPRSHPDHLPTFSLLHSTDMIIRVMQEVKAQEEEYELMKNLAARIKGLPTGFQLARRERRLIAQGLLRRVVLSDKERIALDSSAAVEREVQDSPNTSLSRISSTASDSSSFAGDWAFHPTRTRKMPTSATDHSLQAESITSDVTLDSQRSMSRSTSRSKSSLRGTLRHRTKESSVYAFVFTDLIILTTSTTDKLHILRSPKNATENKETWKLIDDIGISRVLGVTDQSAQLSSHDHLISVELMPMTSNVLDSGVFSDGAAANSLYLSIPDQLFSTTEGAFQAVVEAKNKWLDALERCFRFTLRSLSFPSYAGTYDGNGRANDMDSETKGSVMSILASGLPLPMSPSQQLGETQRGRPTDLVQEEREERGWWSLRFQQVLKEVQRSSRSPVLDAGPSRGTGSDARTKRQGGKRSETRPLILSPDPSVAPRKGGILSLGRKKSK